MQRGRRFGSSWRDCRRASRSTVTPGSSSEAASCTSSTRSLLHHTPSSSSRSRGTAGGSRERITIGGCPRRSRSASTRRLPGWWRCAPRTASRPYQKQSRPFGSVAIRRHVCSPSFPTSAGFPSMPTTCNPASPARRRPRSRSPRTSVRTSRRSAPTCPRASSGSPRGAMAAGGARHRATHARGALAPVRW